MEDEKLFLFLKGGKMFKIFDLQGDVQLIVRLEGQAMP